MKKISQIRKMLKGIMNVDLVKYRNGTFELTMDWLTYNIAEDKIFHSSPLTDVIINFDKDLNLISILVGDYKDKTKLEKFNSVEEMEKANYYTELVKNALDEVERIKEM